jgi:hypothetical protein
MELYNSFSYKLVDLKMSENTERTSEDLSAAAATVTTVAAESSENSRKRSHQQAMGSEGQTSERFVRFLSHFEIYFKLSYAKLYFISSGVEDTCTIADYISELRAQEHEARILLAEASDEHQCTFAGGYVPRQMLYSCVTCARDSGRPVGVCVACSQNCHDDHEVCFGFFNFFILLLQLVELYSKRRFRCDCGTLRCGAAQKCTMRDDEVDIFSSFREFFIIFFCMCRHLVNRKMLAIFMSTILTVFTAFVTVRIPIPSVKVTRTK